MANLGIIPLIPLAIKAIPVVLSFFGGKKAKDKAEQADYEASAQAIQAGQAVSALDLMTERDKQILRIVWGQIRGAGSFESINWAALNMPQGPQLSPNGEFAIRAVWPQVHGAAHFNDVNWQYHAIPLEKAAPVMPLPELGYQTPAPNYNDPRAFQGASLFPGGAVPDNALLLGAAVVAGLIIFSSRR